VQAVELVLRIGYMLCMPYMLCRVSRGGSAQAVELTLRIGYVLCMP
jgi:hypothetical protein